MEKFPICRICLVKNVPKYSLVNKNLRELYEKLTDIPFVTEDCRPKLVCLFCLAKLKQCFLLHKKCLDTEELFALMMDENYKPEPLVNHDHLENYSGFIKTPVEHISIVGQLPAVCEDIFELKKEHQSDDLEPENVYINSLDVEDLNLHYSESDSEGDVPLMMFKTEVKVEEELEVPKNKRRVMETISAPVAKKPKQDTRGTKLEDTITAELKNNEQSKDIRATQNIAKRGTLKVSYKCDECQRSFSRRAHLTNHYRKHTGDKPYICDVCQRSFSVKGRLISHIQIHTGERPFRCDICKSTFREKAALTTHTRKHTGEKPYKCDVCPLGFTQKCDLTRHSRTHTGEKPYKCHVCQRCFSESSPLNKHIRLHTGVKPHKCNLCGHTFIQKIDLTRHILTHTGVKPYKCDICQQGFSRKNSLKNHLNKHM